MAQLHRQLPSGAAGEATGIEETQADAYGSMAQTFWLLKFDQREGQKTHHNTG